MAANGIDHDAMDTGIQEAFSKLSELEKDFAAVELDARTFLSFRISRVKPAGVNLIPGIRSIVEKLPELC